MTLQAYCREVTRWRGMMTTFQKSRVISVQRLSRLMKRWSRHPGICKDFLSGGLAAVLYQWGSTKVICNPQRNEDRICAGCVIGNESLRITASVRAVRSE